MPARLSTKPADHPRIAIAQRHVMRARAGLRSPSARSRSRARCPIAVDRRAATCGRRSWRRPAAPGPSRCSPDPRRRRSPRRSTAGRLPRSSSRRRRRRRAGDQELERSRRRIHAPARPRSPSSRSECTSAAGTKRKRSRQNGLPTMRTRCGGMPVRRYSSASASGAGDAAPRCRRSRRRDSAIAQVVQALLGQPRPGAEDLERVTRRRRRASGRSPRSGRRRSPTGSPSRATAGRGRVRTRPAIDAAASSVEPLRAASRERRGDRSRGAPTGAGSVASTGGGGRDPLARAVTTKRWPTR